MGAENNKRSGGFTTLAQQKEACNVKNPKYDPLPELIYKPPVYVKDQAVFWKFNVPETAGSGTWPFVVCICTGFKCIDDSDAEDNWMNVGHVRIVPDITQAKEATVTQNTQFKQMVEEERIELGMIQKAFDMVWRAEGEESIKDDDTHPEERGHAKRQSDLSKEETEAKVKLVKAAFQEEYKSLNLVHEAVVQEEKTLAHIQGKSHDSIEALGKKTDEEEDDDGEEESWDDEEADDAEKGKKK